MLKVGQYFSQPEIWCTTWFVALPDSVHSVHELCNTTPLKDIIQKHGINYHIYADDTELYLTFRPGVDISNVCSQFKECICDIK